MYVRYAAVSVGVRRCRAAGHRAMEVRTRRGGESSMSSKTLRRSVAVGILAAMTAFAGATPAQAREMNLTGRAWQWMQEAWQLSGLKPWNPAQVPASRTQRNTNKEGWGLDPNGKPAPAPVCGSCGDLGHGIDPNG